VGIPDELAGEIPVAIVKQSQPASVSAEELQQKVLAELGAGYAPSIVLDLQKDLKGENFPTTVSGKIQKHVLRQWTTEYLSNNKSTPLYNSDGTLESQLTAFWAVLSGVKATDISPDVSVHTFTDSMMLVQFSSLVYDKLQKSITFRELDEYKTIRLQADLLSSRAVIAPVSEPSNKVMHQASPFQLLSQMLGDESQVEQVKTKAVARLSSLGLGWEDVEDIIPMTDTMTMMTRGSRPNAWNHRHSIIIKSWVTSELKSILRIWMYNHPLMHSTTISDGSDIDYYMVLSSSDTWLRHQISEDDAIDHATDLLTYKLYDYITPAGPLFKATILPIRDSSDIGVIFHWHHNIFDGLIITRWYAELESLLNRNHSPVPFHPFRDFAIAYYGHRRGEIAQKAVDFHVQRLRGLSTGSQKFWPAQRAPRWLKGDDRNWKHSNGEPGKPGLRLPLDGDRSRGTKGFSRRIHVPNLLELRSRCEIAPPIVAKGACALFDLRATGGEEAVFVTVESGRSWPFSEDAGHNGTVINPLTIDGPTMTETINRIRAPAMETVRHFLTRLQAEQRKIDLYSHAPTSRILECLKQDPDSGEADVEIVLNLLQRQIYDWLPSARPTESTILITGGPTKPPAMEILDVLGRTDLGIVWFPTLIGNDVLNLNATWDDAQLRASEVQEAMSQFMNAIVWLSDPNNLDRPIGECSFTGYQTEDFGPQEDYRR